MHHFNVPQTFHHCEQVPITDLVNQPHDVPRLALAEAIEVAFLGKMLGPGHTDDNVKVIRATERPPLD